MYTLTGSHFLMFFLAYAIAELIDNALSATVKNTGVRTVEIQMVCSTVTSIMTKYFSFTSRLLIYSKLFHEQ